MRTTVKLTPEQKLNTLIKRLKGSRSHSRLVVKKLEKDMHKDGYDHFKTYMIMYPEYQWKEQHYIRATLNIKMITRYLNEIGIE